jgi:hypothetical protein
MIATGLDEGLGFAENAFGIADRGMNAGYNAYKMYKHGDNIKDILSRGKSLLEEPPNEGDDDFALVPRKQPNTPVDIKTLLNHYRKPHLNNVMPTHLQKRYAKTNPPVVEELDEEYSSEDHAADDYFGVD